MSKGTPHFLPPSRAWTRSKRAYSWMQQAACLGHEEIWDSEDWGKVQVAKGQCATCPVRVRCAEFCWSDESSARHGGTWAGKTAVERQAIQRHTGVQFLGGKIYGPVDWAIMLTLDGAEEVSA